MTSVRTALVAAAFSVSIPSCAAFAEAEPPRSAPSPEAPPISRPYPVRVESTMSINIPVVAGSSGEDQVKQIAATRAVLYQAASQDCDTLKQAFRSECRILNVRVNSNVQSRGGSGEIIFVNVSSTYEVTVRPN
jgi:hypothetical protein